MRPPVAGRWPLAGMALLGALSTLGAQRTAPPVLELPASPRALALGEAYGAAAGDDAVLFYNPAQLAAAGPAHRSVAASVQPWLDGARLGSVVAGTSFRGGRLAVGLRLLDYGDEAEIVPDPDYGGERGTATGASVGANEYAISLGYGTTIGPVRAGAALLAARQNIASLSGGKFAADVGIAASLAGGTLAVAVQNVSGEMTIGSVRAPLPMRVRVGIASPPVWLGPLRVDALAEVARVRDGDARPAGGLEARWTSGGVGVAARVGGLPRRTADASGAMVTAGLGISRGAWSLDWALQPVETLGGTTQRIGVTWAR